MQLLLLYYQILYSYFWDYYKILYPYFYSIIKYCTLLCGTTKQ